ncbi:MAG: glycosyltransferase family 2 protein [Patescibacteria group bacterium]
MDLSIIIVNYKSKDKLKNCLNSIFKADWLGVGLEVIVVDNFSQDNLSNLEIEYPNLRLISSSCNLGMGGGNNLGIEAATSEYVLVLNPDTIIGKDAALTLLNYLKNNPGVGLLGPKLLYPDGSLQLSCSNFPGFFIPILRRTFLGNYFKKIRDDFTMNDFDHNSIKEVDWLMGSCLMFRKKQITPKNEEFRPRFDERYFMYFEDTDLARTFKSHGLKVIYNPEAVVIHDHARESAKHPWYIAIFTDRLAWIHISSWFKYFIKWGLSPKFKR